MKPFFEGEQAERHGGRTKAEELRRRVAVVVAASVSVYAVLVVVSLLGGPRIGAPLVPLPGGAGGPQAAAPVAGPLAVGVPGGDLPGIPSGGASEESAVPPLGPPSAGPVDEVWQPSVTTGPGEPRPSVVATSVPPVVEPTTGVAEQVAPSVPPATKLPPRTIQSPAPPKTSDTEGTPDPPVTVDTPPSVTPSDQPTVTPSDPPDDPPVDPPPTLGDVLLDLLGNLVP